jgi:hypothetical protein
VFVQNSQSSKIKTTWGDAEHVVHRLAGELSNKPWLLGDWFTAADIAVGAVLAMALYSKQLPENDILRGLQRAQYGPSGLSARSGAHLATRHLPPRLMRRQQSRRTP